MTPYPSGSPVTITFDLLYADGSVIDSQSASYSVFDKNDQVLVADTAVTGFTANSPTAIVTVLGAINQLSAGDRFDARRVLLRIVTASGEIVEANNNYLIQASGPISLMLDSYQTIQQAELTALTIPGVEAFTGASEQDRVRALIESFNRIGRLKFNIYGLRIPSRGQVAVDNRVNPDFYGETPWDGLRSIPSLNALSAAEFAALPVPFTDAVRRAQIVEANVILGGDAIAQRREEGLMADSVGQSSIMFRPGKPLMLGISRKALEQLSGWVTFNIQAGRS